MKKIAILLLGLLMLTACSIPKLKKEIAASNYYTLEIVETDLKARDWLEEQYKDYSGGWQWKFEPAGFGEKKIDYAGFRAIRDEQGLYTEYILIPKDKKLYVFRTETKPKTETEEDRSAIATEILNKLSAKQ